MGHSPLAHMRLCACVCACDRAPTRVHVCDRGREGVGGHSFLLRGGCQLLCQFLLDISSALGYCYYMARENTLTPETTMLEVTAYDHETHEELGTYDLDATLVTPGMYVEEYGFTIVTVSTDSASDADITVAW